VRASPLIKDRRAQGHAAVRLQGDGSGRFTAPGRSVTDSNAAAHVWWLGLVVAGGLRCSPQGLMHTHVLEALTGGRLVTVDDEVLEAKRQRINAELARDL